jgi:hypothetical protein
MLGSQMAGAAPRLHGRHILGVASLPKLKLLPQIALTAANNFELSTLIQPECQGDNKLRANA